MSDSYHNARIGGISDGSAEGERGASDYRITKRQQQSFRGQQQTEVRNVGREVGDGLMAIIAGIFLHRYFCFVGFWLICFALMAALPVYFDLSQTALSSLEDWYLYVAASVPAVLAVLLRKIIPTMMRWLFFAALAAFVIGLIVTVVQSR
jgi:hypothetical protein